eukprot:scpid79394/ scgid32025/ TNF receptor-associated factor 5
MDPSASRWSSSQSSTSRLSPHQAPEGTQSVGHRSGEIMPMAQQRAPGMNIPSHSPWVFSSGQEDFSRGLREPSASRGSQAPQTHPQARRRMRRSPPHSNTLGSLAELTSAESNPSDVSSLSQPPAHARQLHRHTRSSPLPYGQAGSQPEFMGAESSEESYSTYTSASSNLSVSPMHARQEASARSTVPLERVQQYRPHASEVGGYDAVFIDPVPESLQCPICRKALRAPVQTTCGHRFCKTCIDPIIASSGKNQCPVDRETVQETFPDNHCKREVLSLEVYCDSCSHGCEWRGPLRDLKDHIGICKYKMVHCPNRGCQASPMTLHDLQRHTNEKCLYCPVPCHLCRTSVPQAFLHPHLVKDCLEYEVQCPNRCGVDVKRKNLDWHTAQDCTQDDARQSKKGASVQRPVQAKTSSADQGIHGISARSSVSRSGSKFVCSGSTAFISRGDGEASPSQGSTSARQQEQEEEGEEEE